MGTESLKSHAEYFHDKYARKEIEKLSKRPLIIVVGNGLNTMYSKMVATVKLKTNHIQSITNALFQRLDMKSLFLMTGYF